MTVQFEEYINMISVDVKYIEELWEEFLDSIFDEGSLTSDEESLLTYISSVLVFSIYAGTFTACVEELAEFIEKLQNLDDTYIDTERATEEILDKSLSAAFVLKSTKEFLEDAPMQKVLPLVGETFNTLFKIMMNSQEFIMAS